MSASPPVKSLTREDVFVVASMLTTLTGIILGAIFAAPAHAWYYRSHGPMLSHTPLWILGTYAGCMFIIATASLTLYAKRDRPRALFAGV